jgi:hypothetical protein
MVDNKENAFRTDSKILTTRLREDLDVWPNTTFALIISHTEEKTYMDEGVVIGSNLALTFAKHIYRSDKENKYPNKVEVGVSWDGVVEHDKSEVSKFLVPEEYVDLNNPERGDYDFSVLLLAKSFEERNGYLGLSSVIQPDVFDYYVYAFIKDSKKSETVKLESIKVVDGNIVYTLATPHVPIVGSVLYYMDKNRKSYLVGIPTHTVEETHHAYYLSDKRLDKIEYLIKKIQE